MSMSMNIHRVGKIELTDIQALTCSDERVFYTRSITIFDADGKEIIRLDPMSDNGYNLLVSDDDLAEMNAELPLLKAA